jgi:surface antigen
MRKVIVGLALCAGLSACQPGQPGYGEPNTIGMNNTTGGALIGAAAGGLVGSQFGSGQGKGVATLLGVLAGGVAGSQIGASLDRADRDRLHRTTETALETGAPGQPLPWRNPENGNHGTVTPAGYYQTAGGQYCREFQQTVVVGGQQQQAYGKACREPDGTWKMVQ